MLYKVNHPCNEIVIFKSSQDKSKEYNIQLSKLKNWSHTFFGGLYEDYLNKTDDDKIVVLDEKPNILKVVMNYLKYNIYEYATSKRVFNIIDLAELRERAKFYCIDELENEIQDHIYEIQNILTLDLDIPIFNHTMPNIGIVVSSDLYKITSNFLMLCSYDYNSYIKMSILQQYKINPETNERTSMKMFLICKGLNSFNENVGTFTIKTKNIELRNEHNKLIFTKKDFTFWDGNDRIEMIDIETPNSIDTIYQLSILYASQ